MWVKLLFHPAAPSSCRAGGEGKVAKVRLSAIGISPSLDLRVPGGCLAPKEYKVHTRKVGGPLEFAGLSILKRWLRGQPGIVGLEDVHADPEWFDKGVDLLVTRTNGTQKIDVKVDSYYGADENLEKVGWYHRDSGALLIETVSQLQYDRDHLDKRPDQDGWFFTTTSDEIYQYYLPVLGPYDELRNLVKRANLLAKSVSEYPSVADSCRELGR